MKARMPAGFGRPDMNALMRQAQKMQDDIKAADAVGGDHDEAVAVVVDLADLAFLDGLELRHSTTLHFPYSVGIFSSA